MPFYYNLDGRNANDNRTAQGILRLKEGFAQEKIPKKTVSETLLLASWNIREFESGKYGKRAFEPLYYIAEIISHFDIVAVQEVRDDLSSLTRVMKYLGGWWKYLLTDVTEGHQGNRERMAFIYDSSKVSFGGLAGEIVIPPDKKKGASSQFARTPFMVGFRVGWFKFTICTTHIIYGKSVAESPERIEEIARLSKFLAARTREPYAWAKNMILLGDFNIFDTDDKTFQALTAGGFDVPKQIMGIETNAAGGKHFDQIAFVAPDIQDQLELCSSGTFNFYKYVYRAEDEATYNESMGPPYLKTKENKKRDEKGRTRYYKDWRTFQMSDHFPLWIELKIDFGKEYLEKKVAQKSAPTKTNDPLAPTPTSVTESDTE